MTHWEPWVIAGFFSWCAVAIILGPIIGHTLRRSREAAEAIDRGVQQAGRGCKP